MDIQSDHPFQVRRVHQVVGGRQGGPGDPSEEEEGNPGPRSGPSGLSLQEVHWLVGVWAACGEDREEGCLSEVGVVAGGGVQQCVKYRCGLVGREPKGADPGDKRGMLGNP